MDIQKGLINGTLVEVLPDWHMPAYTLHALTSKREQHPMKVHRCIDALKQYFVYSQTTLLSIQDSKKTRNNSSTELY